MTLDLAKSPPPRLARTIVQRTRGHSHGPITRLVSPSDVGELIKPSVFLDYFVVLGSYSVHTSKHALDGGEARIAEIGKRLQAEGRLWGSRQGQAA